MEGYSTLRRRVETFLKENPDVQAVTLTRPIPAPRIVCTYGSQESFLRMPESCPILSECLDSVIPAGTVVTSEIRDTLFNTIHNRVTEKFREALTDACNEKVKAVKELRALKRRLETVIEWLEYEKPSEEVKPRDRGEVTVIGGGSTDDEEDSEFG